ncbi:hypothetical protein ACPZ19_49200 [Amycolatopsis lurida]
MEIQPVVSPAQAENLRSAVRFASTSDAARPVAQAEPPVPEAPTPPPHDVGAGPYASDPWLLDDWVMEPQLSGLAFAVSPIFPNGSRHLAHFLSGTGEPLPGNADDVLRAAPGLNAKVSEQVNTELQRIAAQAAATGEYGTPVPFTSGWIEYNIRPEENQDWHLALGNVNHSVTGVATVQPPERPGEPPRVQIDYQVHLYDRYNWDAGVPGKQARIFGVIPAPDATLAELHRAGVAKEYNSAGSSTTRSYSGELPR